jgi:outer membrane murein-binding lipoprotein Lpp
MITLHEAISTKIDNISTKLDTLSAKIDTLSTQTSLQISNLSAFKSDIARAESRLSLRIDNFEKRLSATIAKAVWYENRDLGLWDGLLRSLAQEFRVSVGEAQWG